MTVTDKLEVIDNKIKAYQAQYDLNRLAAKVSAYTFFYIKNPFLPSPQKLFKLS